MALLVKEPEVGFGCVVLAMAHGPASPEGGQVLAQEQTAQSKEGKSKTTTLFSKPLK